MYGRFLQGLYHRNARIIEGYSVGDSVIADKLNWRAGYWSVQDCGVEEGLKSNSGGASVTSEKSEDWSKTETRFGTGVRSEASARAISRFKIHRVENKDIKS